MSPAYGEIFAQRGDAYHHAMLRHPDARAAEFAGLFVQAPVQSGERVLDIPAGGGYLRDYLADDVELVTLELTPGFGAGVRVFDPEAKWTFGSFDHIVCLAAMHHIKDPAGWLAKLLAHVRPQGTLHVADVAAGSGIARFLDGFVGRYNLTGHAGSYLAPERAPFEQLGKLARMEVRACPWRFADEDSLLEFCNGLFGLVDCPRAALLEALSEHVGVRRADDGCWLDWELLYIDLQPGPGRVPA